jgi:hypothetical protein
MTGSPMGYTGLEDPMDLYYPTATLPVVYTGTYQIRQFGVGGARAFGAGVSILPALASPPANMTEAATVSATAAAALYVQTQHDKDNYGTTT